MPHPGTPHPGTPHPAFHRTRRARIAAAAVLAAVLSVGAITVLPEPAQAIRRSNGMRYTRAPYPGPGTAPAMEAAIAVTWPDRLERQALNVAWCESKGAAHARNGQYRGHFQMGRREWQRFGSGDPFNPTDNAAAAYRYYSYAGSWRPWECQP